MKTQTHDGAYAAIILGGTGAVGSALVRELLGSPRCTRVIAFVRRRSDALAALPNAATRLAMHEVSMDELEHATRDVLASSPRASAAFCTLGVGQPRKVSREEHWRVDVEYAGAFARAARAAGAAHFSLLSSVSADETSRSRYLRVKGAAEAAVRSADFPRTSFFRPSLLVTPEIRYGLQDRITQLVFPKISGLLPSRYREVTVAELGRAMRLNAERPASTPVEVLHHDDFRALLRDV